MTSTTTMDFQAADKQQEGGFFVSRLDALINWSRKNSLWPLPMGLSCCAIEFMAVACSRYDLARFGAEVARFSPRQADVMIVAGTLTYKMCDVVRRGIFFAVFVSFQRKHSCHGFLSGFTVGGIVIFFFGQ